MSADRNALRRLLDACVGDSMLEHANAIGHAREVLARPDVAEQLAEALRGVVGTLLANVPYDEGNRMPVVVEARDALKAYEEQA